MDMNNYMERSTVLVEALPYIQKWYGKTIVIKYGGNAMISEELRSAVISDIILLHLVGVRVVMVHGGGPEIGHMLEKVGKQSRFVDGLRYTDEETMDIVQQVLCGKVNKHLVSIINNLGGKAIGLCGLDGALFQAKKLDEKYGLVGKITGVNPEPVENALLSGYIPVVSTVAQGVDADTIREMTGLERTEDHGWRFTVDTTPEAAYDGGRTTDQQGGLDDGQNEYDLRGVHGENVRRREAGETIPGRPRSAQRRNAAGSQTDEGGRRAAPASWARGRVIDRPSRAAGIAAENAGRYGADAFVVEDAAIKEKNPNAWALTSGGSVYISDSVPEELAGVVGYHEAVHAARQQGQAQYRDFLENTGDYIDFTSNQSAEIMDCLLYTSDAADE